MSTDTTPESLIGEAKNYEGDNGTARWPSLITDLAAALTDAQTKLTERDAVIAAVREQTERPFTEHMAIGVAIGEILAQSPNDALAAHDAEVARKAAEVAWEIGGADHMAWVNALTDMGPDYPIPVNPYRAEQIGEK